MLVQSAFNAERDVAVNQCEQSVVFAHADVDADLVPDSFFDVDARDELGRGLQRRDEHLRGHRVAVADVAVVVAG